jgi:hypothetical protein
MPTPTIDFQEAATGDIEALIPLIRAYYEFDEILFDDTAIRRGLAELMADRSPGGGGDRLEQATESKLSATKNGSSGAETALVLPTPSTSRRNSG